MDGITNTLHKSILEYILYEINTKNYSADCQESLEVAKQCLETAWNVEASNANCDLLNIFEAGYTQASDIISNPTEEDIEVDDDDRMAAERLKAQGNICMGENLFNDAVSCYSKAIELDPKNAVYYCNRAAAYSKLNRNDYAINDCQHALRIDPKYGKAYSRQGLAYTAMGNFNDAIVCYRRAIELEPDNQNYQQNLQAAEERKASGGIPSSAPGGAAGNAMPNIPNLQSALQNFDISSILNNPAMMNIAQQMMSQPEMRNMMTQMMHSIIPPGGAGTANAPTTVPSGVPTEGGDPIAPTGDATNINDFLTFGQQMAQQMQSANPELVDSLRQRFQESSNATDPSEDSQK